MSLPSQLTTAFFETAGVIVLNDPNYVSDQGASGATSIALTGQTAGDIATLLAITVSGVVNHTVAPVTELIATNNGIIGGCLGSRVLPAGSSTLSVINAATRLRCPIYRDVTGYDSFKIKYGATVGNPTTAIQDPLTITDPRCHVFEMIMCSVNNINIATPSNMIYVNNNKPGFSWATFRTLGKVGVAGTFTPAPSALQSGTYNWARVSFAIR